MKRLLLQTGGVHVWIPAFAGMTCKGLCLESRLESISKRLGSEAFPDEIQGAVIRNSPLQQVEPQMRSRTARPSCSGTLVSLAALAIGVESLPAPVVILKHSLP